MSDEMRAAAEKMRTVLAARYEDAFAHVDCETCGGTIPLTMSLRRDALEAMNAWDAAVREEQPKP
jgi:hypothetical protein